MARLFARSMCALLFVVLDLVHVRHLMSRAKLRNIWSYIPAWTALLLGGGALMSTARADVSPQPSSRPETHEVVVKMDGDNILISQDGRNFEALPLGDTREAAHLRKLLRDEAS